MNSSFCVKRTEKEATKERAARWREPVFLYKLEFLEKKGKYKTNIVQTCVDSSWICPVTARFEKRTINKPPKNRLFRGLACLKGFLR